MKYVLLIGCLVLGGCATNGAGPTRAAAQSSLHGNAKSEPAREPKVVCRSEEESGSHLSRRVCRKVRDMEIERERDRQFEDSNEITRPVSGGG